MGVHNLARTDDERRSTIRTLLASGTTIKAIAQQLKCSRMTVCAVREMDAEPIADEARTLARKYQNLAQMAVEQATERIAGGEEPSLKELTILSAVSADKMLVLSGAPTARVEHIKGESAADLREALTEALDLARMKAASVEIGTPAGITGAESSKEPAAAAGVGDNESPGPARGGGLKRGRGGSAKRRGDNIHKDPNAKKNSSNEPN